MEAGPTPPPPPREHRGGSFGFLHLVGGFAALLILYALSIGPVARYYRRSNPPMTVTTFYTPIVFLGNSVRPVGWFLNWYVNHLWQCAPPGAPTNSTAPTKGK